jgi:hypothetical protein
MARPISPDNKPETACHCRFAQPESLRASIFQRFSPGFYGLLPLLAEHAKGRSEESKRRAPLFLFTSAPFFFAPCFVL